MAMIASPARRKLLLAGVAVAAVPPTRAADPAEAAQASAAPLPRPLRQAAVVTPRALRAGTLALARAGERLVAVGERGTVLLSDDAGATWRQAKVPVQATLTGVRFADARHGWAVGHLGVILRTEDGGETWARQLDGVQVAQLALQAAKAAGDAKALQEAQRWVDEGPDKPFLDIEALDAQRAIAVGAYGMVHATADGGRTWAYAGLRLEGRPGLHLYAVRRAGERLWLAGEQGQLMRSDDAGASFHALASPYKGSWFGLLMMPSGTLLAYGLRGTAYRSTDAGQSWEKAETGDIVVGFSAARAGADGRVMLLSQNGDLLASQDDGRRFERVAGLPMPAADLMQARAERGAPWVLAGLSGLRTLRA